MLAHPPVDSLAAMATSQKTHHKQPAQGDRTRPDWPGPSPTARLSTVDARYHAAQPNKQQHLQRRQGRGRHLAADHNRVVSVFPIGRGTAAQQKLRRRLLAGWL